MDADGAVRWLLRWAPRVAQDDLPLLVKELAPGLGATSILVYLVDYSQTRLVPLLPGAGVRRAAKPIDGSVAGRAYSTGLVHQEGGRVGRVWVPLAHGGDRLGVLEVNTAGRPGPEVRAASIAVAELVAQLLLTRQPQGDLIERVRRREPMQLAAEIVWGILPPLSFTTDRVQVAGVLEPCLDIGGDAFDYALNGDTLSVAIFDAVGHGNPASLLATLAIGAYRNARRTGLGLVDAARSVDKHLQAYRAGVFVSAVLAELDCTTGALNLVVAGHPAPLLLRQNKLVKEFPGPSALPLGLEHMSPVAPRFISEHMQPGDQVLFYTDGVIEARTQDGEFFGLDRLVDFVTRALADRLPLPETMRRLVRAILAHQHDQLQDDATAVLVQWRGPTAAAG